MLIFILTLGAVVGVLTGIATDSWAMGVSIASIIYAGCSFIKPYK